MWKSVRLVSSWKKNHVSIKKSIFLNMSSSEIKLRYQRILEIQSHEIWRVPDRLVSALELIKVTNGTGPGVHRSKNPLTACYIRCKCSIETSQKSAKSPVQQQGHELVQCLIDEGYHCIWTCSRMSRNIWERRIVLFEKILELIVKCEIARPVPSDRR